MHRNSDPLPRPAARPPAGNATAFTLIELLVAISIIAVLVGILLPALSGARQTAKQARGLSDLKQMMLGYATYYEDHAGQVLWGYTPNNVGGVPIEISTAGHTFSTQIADRYPWRFAPYVANLWEILHSHGEVPELPRPDQATGDAFWNAYWLSIEPTYGINSAYVGGDKNFGGFVVNPSTGYSEPNRGAHVVFQRDDPRIAASLIVFAETQGRNGDSPAFRDKPQGGFHIATPPRAKGLWWEPQSDRLKSLRNSQFHGVPQGRYGNHTQTAFFDGHVEHLDFNELADMRYWANDAKSPTYDYAN